MRASTLLTVTSLNRTTHHLREHSRCRSKSSTDPGNKCNCSCPRCTWRSSRPCPHRVSYPLGSIPQTIGEPASLAPAFFREALADTILGSVAAILPHFPSTVSSVVRLDFFLRLELTPVSHVRGSWWSCRPSPSSHSARRVSSISDLAAYSESFGHNDEELP